MGLGVKAAPVRCLKKAPFEPLSRELYFAHLFALPFATLAARVPSRPRSSWSFRRLKTGALGWSPLNLRPFEPQAERRRPAGREGREEGRWPELLVVPEGDGQLGVAGPRLAVLGKRKRLRGGKRGEAGMCDSL